MDLDLEKHKKLGITALFKKNYIFFCMYQFYGYVLTLFIG